MRTDRRPTLASLVLAMLAVCATGASAQAPAAPQDSLNVAVDRWVERGLARYEIAGAALAIVRDGRIVHQRGFGLADVERRVPVDPGRTVFHIASVTKLLTAIAALQEVEAGRLELHRDVRPMLGEMRAGGWSDHRVTLHQLLTHTAGLDVRWIGIAEQDPARVRPLAAYLPRAMPPIVDEPGTTVRYSNHGYAAVGRLIEVASGAPWAERMEQGLLAPLGMARSYASPRARGPGDAVPYFYRGDTLAEPDIHEHVAPAGAVRSTAADLARLMIALLDSSSAPLSPRGKAMVLAPQHRMGGVEAYAYGSFPYPNDHVAAASMGGEVPGFSTRLLLVPSLRLGVVLMVNRKDPSLALVVFDSLLARVAPARRGDAQCGTGAGVADGANPEGRWRSNVYDRGSFLRLGVLLGPVLIVRRDTGQGLVVVNPLEDEAARWRRVGDSTWAGPRGTCLSLVRESGEPMVALSTRSAGPIMLERVRAGAAQEVVLLLVALAVVVLLLAGTLEAVRALRRRGAGEAAQVRRGRVLAIAVAVTHLGSIALLTAGLYTLAIARDDRFAFGIPAWVTAGLVLPWLALLLTAWLAVLLVRARGERWPGRWRGWLATVASAVLLFELWSWGAMFTG